MMEPKPTPLPASLAIMLAVTGLIVAACTIIPREGAKIYDGSEGSVSLEDLPDQTVRVTHPVTLPPALLMQLLRGLHVKDQPRLLQTLTSGFPQPNQVFSDDAAALLGPHIASALAKAQPSQWVRFRMLTATATGTETSEGTVYRTGSSLYVTLQRYRYNPARQSGDSKPLREPLERWGFDQRTLLFFPEAARSSDDVAPPIESPHRTTVGIDYAKLQTFPETASRPIVPQPPPSAQVATTQDRPRIVPPGVLPPGALAGTQETGANTTPLAPPAEPAAGHNQDMQAIKDLLIKRDLELQATQKELQEIKKKLAEQESKPKNPKQSKNKKALPDQSKQSSAPVSAQ